MIFYGKIIISLSFVFLIQLDVVLLANNIRSLKINETDKLLLDVKQYIRQNYPNSKFEIRQSFGGHQDEELGNVTLFTMIQEHNTYKACETQWFERQIYSHSCKDLQLNEMNGYCLHLEDCREFYEDRNNEAIARYLNYTKCQGDPNHPKYTCPIVVEVLYELRYMPQDKMELEKNNLNNLLTYTRSEYTILEIFSVQKKLIDYERSGKTYDKYMALSLNKNKPGSKPQVCEYRLAVSKNNYQWKDVKIENCKDLIGDDLKSHCTELHHCQKMWNVTNLESYDCQPHKINMIYCPIDEKVAKNVQERLQQTKYPNEEEEITNIWQRFAAFQKFPTKN